MPHLWNNKVVVTREELVPAYFSDSNLDKTIQRYKKSEYGIKRVTLGGNGRQMLIDFDSLDSHVQYGIGDPRKLNHILENYYDVDGAAVRFFSKEFKFSDETRLETEFQERYVTNASVLNALIALRSARENQRRSQGHSSAGITQTLLDDAQSFQEILEKKYKTKHTLPSGYKQFTAVLKKYQSEGYKSLVSAKHKNSNTLKVTDSTIELLNNLFAGQSHKPTATEVHRQYSSFLDGYLVVINNNSGEIYNPKDFKKLSTVTVTNYMAQWANKIGTWDKRSGDRQKLMGQFKPYHSFDKVKYAGSMISIDDRQPPFKTLSGERIWFYNGIDLGSEAFTCWVYGDSKDGIITEFYRQMVRNYADWGFNLPHELECEMSLNSSFRETFLKPGAMFQAIKMEANNARGKRIEKYFDHLRYRVESERTGWLARPGAKRESQQSKVAIEKVPRIPFDEIVSGCLQDIENWNNEMHSVHTNLSRWEVFCQMQNPNLVDTNYEAILPHIGRKTATSCNVGHVKLNNGLFLIGDNGKVATGKRLVQLMSHIEGHEIDVYWLDGNDGNVIKALAFIGSELICELVKKPTYSRATIEQTPDDLAAKTIISKYVETIDAFGRNQKHKLDQVTLINNAPKIEKSFVMPGLYKATIINNDEPAEVLDDLNDETFDMPAYHGVKSLKDRY